MTQHTIKKYLKLVYFLLGGIIILVGTIPLLDTPTGNGLPDIYNKPDGLKVNLSSIKINDTAIDSINNGYEQLSKLNPEDTFRIELLLLNNSTTNEFIMDLGNFGRIDAKLLRNGVAVADYKTGKLLNLEERQIESYKAILPLHLEKDSDYKLILTCYKHLPQFQPRNLVFQFLTEAEWVKLNYFRYASQSLFIGCIIVMALYNLLLFFAVRDVSYLYYVLSIIGVGIYFSFYYGFSLEFVWPDSPRWDAYSFGFVLPLTGIVRLLFTKSYLKPEIHRSYWDKILNSLSVLYALPILLTFWSLANGEQIAAGLVYIIGVLGNIVLLTMLMAGFYAHFNGYKPAKFFILANLFFIVGGILFILREVEILPNNMFTTYSVQVGILAQVILFSLGLADRLNRMRLQLAEDELQQEKSARKEEINRKKELSRQKIELEKLVTERTADLNFKTEELEKTVAELKNSQIDLQSANKVKDKMFTLIAHDLKAPLATFDSFLNILINHIDEMSEAQRKKLVASTKSSLQSINILLDNLLKWSRSQLSPAIADRQPIDFNQIVTKTIELFQFAMVSKNIRLNYDLKGEGQVMADKNMIETVVRNLINNAIKFTPKGKSIELFTSSDEKSFYFRIFNSSADISPEIINQISRFDGVFKTKGTDNEHGYGLGLMLCNEFIRKNKGTLVADIERGEGITFSVAVPKVQIELLRQDLH